MAVDSSLPFRRAIVSHLKTNGPVTTLVDPASIYSSPPAQPVWPFIRYGVPNATPFLASGMDGAAISTVIHAFAKGATDDTAASIGAAIASALGGAILTMEDGSRLLVTWISTQTMQDGDEANAWHAVVSIRGEAITAPH